MKPIALIASLALALAPGATAADPATQPEQQMLAVIKEIQAQQAAMAENQAKIEARLATVTETVRIAKIYSSRGGR